MKKHCLFVFIFLIMFPKFAVAEDAQAKFTNAKKLIEENCADCMGASRKGLEDGISKLLEAIKSGYQNKEEAYILLRDAYNTLEIVYAVPDSTDQKNIRVEIRKINEQLLQLDPNNPKILYEYARYLKDKDAQLSTYKKILQIDPENVDARFAAGKLLVEKGKIDDGINELKEALKRAKGRVLENYKRRAVEILNQHGRKKEAKEIERQ